MDFLAILTDDEKGMLLLSFAFMLVTLLFFLDPSSRKA